MKRLMALMALAVLTACDYVGRSDFRKERKDTRYRSAMEDYRAGRIDAAIGGFRTVVAKDPANASARFQLACLLQDAKADYLGAFCAYREYLAQHPESDKAKLARNRLEKCELELAKFLASKHGLADKDGFVRENEALKNDLRAADLRVSTAEKESEVLRARVTALSAERERLLKIIKGGPTDSVVASQAQMARSEKDLLEEDDDDADRVRMSADVASLRAEAAEELSTGSDILPAQRAVTNVVKTVRKKVPDPEPRQIPETHVVQEGDTLYGIAKRYYGRLSVWRKIRDMNKGLISSDNRLHVGDTLRLPR